MGVPPNALVKPFASITRLPEVGPASSAIAAVPCRRTWPARSSRSAAKARTRPWLRFRRAEMPSTAQRASARILRSSCGAPRLSSAQTVSRQSSKPS